MNDEYIMGASPHETAERMVYVVPSDTKQGREYRVDLLAHGGASECCCVDWAARRWPAIRDGKVHGTRLTMCRHVIKARRHFLNGLLTAMAKSEEGSP